MNAICLAIDRLHLGYVGAYGNSWIETPSLDRLACESFTFDQFLLDSPRLESFCRSCWQGLHALADEAASPPRSLPALLGQAGIRTMLVTDEPAVATHTLADDFEDVARLSAGQAREPAGEIEAACLAQTFAQLIDRLEAQREPFFWWCHLRGLGGSWDAPLDLRARYREEGDPEPLRAAEVPCLLLEKDYDPDDLLAITQAYAGQMTLLDTCLGAFLEFFQGGPLADNTLLVLLSARGFPLGEHRRVGPCDDALYAELVHVPWMIRFPDGLGASARSQALVQPADLYATILDWFAVARVGWPSYAASLLPLVRYDAWTVHDRLAIVGSGNEKAIRTPAWYLRDADQPELFAKPDDLWEACSVAERYPELVLSLRTALSQFEDSTRSCDPCALPPLDDLLLTGIA